MAFLRGQGYDGAAAMSGKYNGVRAHINQSHPLAIYVHCAAHSFNLAVSKSCSIQSIRNCIGTVGKAHDLLFCNTKTFLETSSQADNLKTAIL